MVWPEVALKPEANGAGFTTETVATYGVSPICKHFDPLPMALLSLHERICTEVAMKEADMSWGDLRGTVEEEEDKLLPIYKKIIDDAKKEEKA